MLNECYMTYYLSKNGNFAFKQVTVRSSVTFYEYLLLYSVFTNEWCSFKS